MAVVMFQMELVSSICCMPSFTFTLQNPWRISDLISESSGSGRLCVSPIDDPDGEGSVPDPQHGRARMDGMRSVEHKGCSLGSVQVFNLEFSDTDL